ncbi:DUF6056 family protein [Pseudobutyrivibrio sp.]|uniref:DUF6056 family protein n=1 Tax=Pseudobutyrivibrio sp. TaxID=2014367 RepID=UPI002ED61452
MCRSKWIAGYFFGGGSLTVSGIGAYFAVLVCIYMFMIKRKVNISNLIVTVLWISGAAFNAVAPGNFIRHADTDQTGVHPLEAFGDAFDMANIRWQFFFQNTNFVFLMLIVTLIGFYIAIKTDFNNKDEFRARCIVTILGLFTPVVTSFPLALGYSSDMIPNRCEFVIDFSIIISAVTISFMAGVLIAKYISSEQRNIIVIFMIMLMAMAFMLDGYGYQNIKINEIAEQLSDGEYKNHYFECKGFVLGLENYDKNADIRISRNMFPAEIDNTQNFYLSTDPEHWLNRSLAEYYGFNSIAISEE